MIEEWRAVIGYEGLYEVSSIGRVRSLDRLHSTPSGKGRLYPGKLLSPGIEKRSGYRAMGLYKNNRGRMVRVHCLVLDAFVGPRQDNQVARHLNGNPADNRLENLAWGTRLENARDAQVHGTWVHGESHGMAKLTELQAQAIFHLSGLMPRPAIAEAFGVSTATVQSIHEQTTWRVATGCRWLPEGVK